MDIARWAWVWAGATAAWSRVRVLYRGHPGAGCHLRGRIWIHGRGRLSLGDRVTIDARLIGVELHIHEAAELTIGNDVFIGDGTSIEATQQIAIGDRCRVGRRCKLLDNHLHALTRGGRDLRPGPKAVVLEPDVVVDDFAVVLPGARLGGGARVGRGAVASRPVPPGAVVPPQAVHIERAR